MAKGDRKGNQSGAQAPEQTTAIEQPPETPAGSQESHDGGAAEVSLTTAPETAPGEPGPEEYERHDNRRLMAEHDEDVRRAEALRSELEPIEARLAKRGSVIAERLIAKAKADRRVNPVVTIGGRKFTPKARAAKHGGGFHLVSHSEREEASLD